MYPYPPQQERRKKHHSSFRWYHLLLIAFAVFIGTGCGNPGTLAHTIGQSLRNLIYYLTGI